MTITLRRATLKDIGSMLSLINRYAANGIMLPRTEFELAASVREFVIAFSGDAMVGCGALHSYTPAEAEVRSLAVDPACKSSGIGRAIVDALLDEARRNELDSVFAFTYAPGFFEKLGFERATGDELPLKTWKDCIRCPKYACCDETPMLKRLNEAERRPFGEMSHLLWPLAAFTSSRRRAE